MRVIDWFSAEPVPQRSNRCRRWACPAVLAAFFAVSPIIAAAQTLKIGGTGSGLPTMELLAAEFSKVAPDVAVSLFRTWVPAAA